MQEFHTFFLNNHWEPSTGDDTLSLISPVTEMPRAQLRMCAAADVDRAVASARRALPDWSRSSLEQRKQVLRELANAIEARREAFVEILAAEIGAPRTLSNLLNIPMPIKNLESMLEGMDAITWEETIGNARVVREAVGVLACITPWNVPIHQIIAKLGGAIGAGCSVVLKPSEIAPGVVTLLGDALAETSLPAGVINIVWGGREVGQQLVKHPEVNMISFTGSDAVGKQIMHSAADGFKRIALELGGKSAALLLDDAPLEQAVTAVVRQSMANSGQTCVCQSRLLVPRAQLVRVETLAAKVAGQIKLGAPGAEDTIMGPMGTRSQLERANTMIDAAVASGAKLVSGGSGRPEGFQQGYFIAPTVLSDVDPAMPVAQQEVFGPVLSIIPYDDAKHAVEIANGTPYGLSGAVWSADVARAEQVAKELHTGQIVINGAAQNLATPFGGVSQSGFGRENGRFSIESFLEYKSIQGVR